MKPLDERSYAFVIRVWEERREGSGTPTTWRGSIDDVQRGTRSYFDSLRELSEHIRRQSGMATESTPHRATLACAMRRSLVRDRARATSD